MARTSVPRDISPPKPQPARAEQKMPNCSKLPLRPGEPEVLIQPVIRPQDALALGKCKALGAVLGDGE